MLQITQSFVFAELISIAMGAGLTPENKENLSFENDPIIPDFLNKLSGFIDHNNTLRKPKTIGAPSLTSESSLLTF